MAKYTQIEEKLGTHSTRTTTTLQKVKPYGEGGGGGGGDKGREKRGT